MLNSEKCAASSSRTRRFVEERTANGRTYNIFDLLLGEGRGFGRQVATVDASYIDLFMEKLNAL